VSTSQWEKNDYSVTLFDLRVKDRDLEEQKKEQEREYWLGLMTGLVPMVGQYLAGIFDQKKGVYNPPFSDSHPHIEEYDEDDFDPANFVDPKSGYVREVRNMSDLIKVANEFNARLQRIEKHLADDGEMSSDA